MGTGAGTDEGIGSEADIVLVGGGIMSATLGSMIAILQPDWRVVLVERAGELATESSDPWNNAGTGHMGLCELNYMPDPADRSRATTVAAQFHLSRQWWAYLADAGFLDDPQDFVSTTPHMDVVFGSRDVDYLQRRFQTLAGDPLFAEMAYSEDPAQIAAWSPLVMEGREPGEPIAATRHPRGTDVDFGALTKALTRIIVERGGQVLLDHDVRTLRQNPDRSWCVTGKQTRRRQQFTVRAQHVFVGAGGFALRLLQKAGIPEIDGYAVLPVGAAFYRCATPSVVARHDAKVYGQAAVGAPPMSVPHLDKRIVDHEEYLLFGPYATFSTKLLKHGRFADFFTTLRWRNVHVLLAACLQNLSLIRFLLSELVAGPKRRFMQLQKFFPAARSEQWELISAGQRAQLVTPDSRRTGVLQHGTELIVSADHSISGLLGASPGASTAVPIMVDLLRQCFPKEWDASWKSAVEKAIPDFERVRWDREAAENSLARSASALGLRRAS
ncbi:malate dehydrogenase (quinone) [Gordonia hankookensis]|uniref:Probable malate:quinone oxidoreductase n=1 Tax=Gordonia hankookensis TaxID=589403 RepID=A0ABR7WBV6_9ACTN|nr:malate dehydrogenase (quinone) [Gordonia hankookensis]MBD1320289.1 malate dehydrogenase (quinone) [Gordonia hankookensis]